MDLEISVLIQQWLWFLNQLNSMVLDLMTCLFGGGGLDSYKIHVSKCTYPDREIIRMFYSLVFEGFKSTPWPSL